MALATWVASDRVLGRSPPDGGCTSVAGGGVACQCIRGTGRLLEPTPGCCPS